MEIGVWQGWSLAVWSQYFTNAADIVGVDVFRGPWDENQRVLRSRGAFPRENCRVIEADSTTAASVSHVYPISQLLAPVGSRDRLCAVRINGVAHPSFIDVNRDDTQ